MVTKNIKSYLVVGLLGCGALFTSCSSMLETDSELVEFEDDNTLSQATDSVYSVLGIINKLQTIADRTVLLGSTRGDLMTVTDAASIDLKNLSSFNLQEANKYNVVSDYYAIINNCNYYLAHVDTAMVRRGRKLFLPEYAVVKSYRAWTYLQLAMNYGRVPLILKPLMTEKDAREAMHQTPVNMKTICDTFIDELTPLVGVNLPKFGTIDSHWDAQQFMIPMKVLLGELCLWGGRYAEAAKWYHEFLTDKDDPIHLRINRTIWPNYNKFDLPSTGYAVMGTAESLAFIPMEGRIFDGVVSDIPNIYRSTTQNNYFFQMSPSVAMSKISAAQHYCIENKVNTTRTDTLYAPREGFTDESLIGDLRLYSNYTITSYGQQNEYSEYNSTYQFINKAFSSFIPFYRRTMVYLHYAEALNRAGYPQSAMVILKYGMCDESLKAHVDETERSQAGDLIYFDPQEFKLFDDRGSRLIYGIHSFGSGDAHVDDSLYVLPQPATELATRQDTVDYQIPLVEDMIVTEMALEGAFEGSRYYDLMRVALRRSDPAYLAKPVSLRNGTEDTELQTKLMNPDNWYLPLP